MVNSQKFYDRVSGKVHFIENGLSIDKLDISKLN